MYHILSINPQTTPILHMRKLKPRDLNLGASERLRSVKKQEAFGSPEAEARAEACICNPYTEEAETDSSLALTTHPP